MKPLNNNTVRKGYLRFSGFLIICVAVSVFCFYSYMKTASTEVKMIMAKTVEYDNIYSAELNMVVAVDSIYQYMSLMNSSPKINDLLLQSVVSNRKMQLQNQINALDEKDFLLYKKLAGNINVFLGVKDSIRLAEKEESIVREDLMRCVKENREISRKLKVGGIVFYTFLLRLNFFGHKNAGMVEWINPEQQKDGYVH